MDDNNPKRARAVGPEGHTETAATYAWKMCSDRDDIIERIPIKEHAVERAIHHVTQLCDLLRKYAKNDHSEGAKALQRWIDLSDATIQKHRDFEVLVGVSGLTGAGKTSLLNALLESHELLPSSQQQAATAVSCKVSWNYDSTPGSEYRAEISFQTYDEVMNQIVLTLEAFKMHEQVRKATYTNSSDQIKDGAEAAALKKECMNKIDAVWKIPETEVKALALKCDGPEELEDAAKQILNRNARVVEFLKNKVTMIHSANREEFRRRVKPFLDSTTATHGHTTDFAVWPLIKGVKVYLNSDILRSGICLVDLPGAGDNVESRAKVAEDYRRELEVTMIVAAMIRAADEKGTQKLLNTSQELRMQVGKGFNPHAFGVILSKMDDIDTAPYVETEDAENVPFVFEHNGKIEAAREQMKVAQQEKKTLERTVKKAKSQIKKLESLKTLSKNLEKQGQLRTAKAERDMASERIEDVGRRISSLDDEIRLSRVHLEHWALMARNESVQERFRQNFETRQIQLYEEAGVQPLENASTALDVVSCSARAFWSLRDDDRNLSPFPSKRYTGIPFVASWIHLATAARREQHLDSVLEEFRNGFGAIEKWRKTKPIDLPVQIDVKALRAKIAEANTTFEKELSAYLLQFHKEVDQMNPFTKATAAKVRKAFKVEATRVAARWSLKYPDDETASVRMPWNTYVAITRRGGGPYTPPSNRELEYDWIPKLAEPLVMRLTSECLRFHVNTQVKWEAREEEVRQRFKSHFGSIAGVLHESEASLDNYFSKIEGDVTGVHGMVNRRVKEIIGLFQRATHADTATIDAMRRSLAQPFEMCKDIKGPGSYLKRRELLEMTVERNATKYFDAAWNAIKNDLSRAKAELRRKLEDLASQAVRNVRSPIDISIDNHFGDVKNPKKLDAQSQVEQILDAWRNDWQFPTRTETHIFERDESIPSRLDPNDLARFLEDKDSDSESYLSESEDAEKEKLKYELDVADIKKETSA